MAEFYYLFELAAKIDYLSIGVLILFIISLIATPLVTPSI